MDQYVGGDFDSLSEVVYEKAASDSYKLYFPEKINNCFRNLFETGTDSLAQIVSDIYSENHRTVRLWFPAHYCLETILRLQKKLEERIPLSIARYNSFSELLISNECTNVLLFNHFNRYQETTFEIIEKYKNENWLVVEDFVHAPFEIIKMCGNYSFNSLRKIAGLEVSVCYTSRLFNDGTRESSTYYKLKKEAAKIKSNFFKSREKDLELMYLNLFKKAESNLLCKEIITAQKQEIEKLMRIEWTALLAKRIENYNYLVNKIGSIKQIEIQQGRYMYVMLKVEERDELKQFMYSNGVFPVIHWPDSLDEIKNNLLSFHIDHRYNKMDLERVYLLMEKFYASK